MSKEKEDQPSLQELAKIAAPIAKNAQLQSIMLRSITADKLVENLEEFSEKLELVSRRKLSHRLTPETPDRAARLFVDVTFFLQVRGNEPDGKTSDVASLEATLGLCYAMSRGMPEEAKSWLSAFAQTNSLVHAWPYYRELVQSTAWRMGLPPFSLPLLQLGGPRTPKPAADED